MIRAHIYPTFGAEDNGDGGIRRVVEAQRRHLPAFGVEVVERPEDADIIAGHAIIPASYIKRFPGKPFVSHCHGLYWSEYQWGGVEQAVNTQVMDGIRAADLTTAPTEWVAQAIRRHSNRRVAVVPHGIDLDDWPFQEENLGYVYWDKSRVDPVCDPEAAMQLAARLPNVPFVSTFGKALPNVRLMGRMPFAVAKPTMQRAGVYLATARETGQSMSVLEALASGVPVVAWRWGGMAETLTHRRDGYLARPGDIDDLAEGVRWALDNRQLISPASRQTAERYRWQDAAERYAGLYSHLVAEYQGDAPLVTIVVTAYNLERFLADCLSSVEAQTLQSWECIVVDDASPDGSGDLAEGYAARDPRFRVIHNQVNQYLAEARNTGIRQARGRYVLPLDADDMLAPTALDQLAGALERDRNLQIAYGNVLFIEDDGRQWHSPWPSKYDLGSNYSLDAWLDQEQTGQPLPYCSMFRRDVWELTGGYRARCRTSEDQDFWLRAISYGFRAAYVTDSDTLLYRNRADSMSKQQGWQDHRPWFPWKRDRAVLPAAAPAKVQLPVHSCDPLSVSVIIPVGPGHQRYVKDAVDSVDAQSFRLWECIVVNDTGSELPELPQWVRIIETGPVPRGVAAARNLGIAASKAPVYLPLDADDYLQPNALSQLLGAMRTGEQMPVVYSDFWENPQLEMDGTGRAEPDSFKVYETKDYEPQQLLKGCIYPNTALTPKDLWVRVGGYDETIPAWEDWDFHLRTAAAGWPCRRIAEPLWTYRKETGLRRNENVANFEASRQAILDRWGPYWRGVKSMPACGSCGGKNRTMATRAQTIRSAPRSTDGWVKLRYFGSKEPRTWKGPSGRQYRLDPNHPFHYVDPLDAQFFLGYPAQFELVPDDANIDSPTGFMELEAGGNPNASRRLQQAEHQDRRLQDVFPDADRGGEVSPMDQLLNEESGKGAATMVKPPEVRPPRSRSGPLPGGAQG